MTRYLLDVNALIALGHRAHVHHRRVIRWYAQIADLADALCTCSITELGFVRVAVQVCLQKDVATARAALFQMKRSGRLRFDLLEDGLAAEEGPSFAGTPGRLADGHLLRLADHHRMRLATLDSGIPGALLIPEEGT